MTMNSFAELQLTRIFNYEEDLMSGGQFYIYYNDQYIIPLDMSLIRGNHVGGNNNVTLIPGETCVLKVYNSPLGFDVDSCVTTFNYIPQTYEDDGQWYYKDNGTIADPGGSFGIYNIFEDVPIDPGELSDLSEEEYAGVCATHGAHFITDYIGLYIKIEIYVYRNVP